MTIPKEYNRNTSPPTLMNPHDYEVEAEVKARFGIDKPVSGASPLDFLRAAAVIVQDHGTELSFEALRYQAGELARTQTLESGYRVVVNRWWLGVPGGEVGAGELIVGWNGTSAFCEAIQTLIEDGTLQVCKPDRVLHVARDPANKPIPPGLMVTIVEGPCPDGVPRG
jgi:hypothetical protein